MRRRVTAESKDQRESSDNSEAESLVLALCERLGEVLPADEFEVTVEHGKAVRILGRGSRYGSSLWLTPIAIWRSQLPAEDRMQLFLEQACRRLQDFVSHGRKARWPARAAKPRVSIGEDRILVWWGGPGEDEADVALRPIVRSEIGI